MKLLIKFENDDVINISLAAIGILLENTKAISTVSHRMDATHNSLTAIHALAAIVCNTNCIQLHKWLPAKYVGRLRLCICTQKRKYE